MSADMSAEYHLEPKVVDLYRAGRLGFDQEASVEAHLLACPSCRDMLRPAVETERLEAIWEQVIDQSATPQPNPVERFLTRCGLSETTARVVTTTPSLRVAWTLALIVVLVFALMAAGSGEAGVRWFLVMAPLLPFAGVACAYGPAADPAYELTVAAPYHTVRLILVRSCAVIGTSMMLTGGASVFLPAGAPATAWLLPALALSAATLALATRIDPARAGTAIVAAWVLIVLSTRELDVRRDSVLFEMAGQVGWAVVLLGSAAVFLILTRADSQREVS
jgi:hypothetical protein